ncbi:PD-(D/E)XK nuclease-like domain-containing protein [Limosilactobacillus reuteri]|uniref:PD-(D/E)XK nuclease-like domain-containing protein n=1 Tax=Limosilactobacillus reuteri TaxID=1598 RepID=UPI003D062A1A
MGLTKVKKNSSRTEPLPLTQSNYYDHDTDFQYMSKSVFQGFEECEAEELAELKGEWDPDDHKRKSSQPDPLIFGNFIHSYFQGKEAHEEFLKETKVKKEVFKYGNPEKGAKKAYDKNGEAYSLINKMKLNKYFNRAYKPRDPKNKEVIVTGEIGGYLWKGKIDSLNLEEQYFCDLKTTKDIHAVNWIKKGDRNIKTNFVESYGYYMQMAIYQELIRQTFDITCLPLMFVVSKQQPIPEVCNLKFDQYDPQHPDVKYLMDDALETAKKLQPHFWKVMMGEEKPRRCGKCAYCRYTNNSPEFILPTQIEV